MKQYDLQMPCLSICFDILNLSLCINKNPVVNDLIDANHMPKKVKSKGSMLNFPNFGSVDDLKNDIIYWYFIC